MLTELSLAQLNVAYNRAVSELGLPLKEIKGFKDKPSGVARLTKVIADHDLVLDGTKLVRNGLAGLNADMAGFAAHGVEAPVAGTGNGLEGLANSLSGNVVQFKAGPAKKAAPTVKAAKPAPKAKVGKVTVTAAKRGPVATFQDHQVITMLVATNPKKPNSMARKRFALYVDGMTVKQALDTGLRRDDFRWDTDKGHISIK